MITVKFNDTSIKYKTKYTKVSNHVIQLTDVPTNASGFFLTGKHENDFTDFTTIYRVLDNAVQFSNDGSIYIEPVIIEMPKEEAIPTPSLDERVSALEDAVVEIMEVI